MARQLTAALALSAGLALAACGTTASHPAAAHTSAVSAPNPTAASPSAAHHHHHHHRAQATAHRRSRCDAALWAHVYHPDRLQIVRSCMTVRGRVDAVRQEPDGDLHILLATRPALVNSANVAYEHGDLVLEEICQGPVTQADAIDACQGVPHNLTVPSPGDRVRVVGSYVLDADHGWMEIHPVTRLRILGSAPAPAPAPAPSSAAPPPAPGGCHPTTSSGNCYEPGEFCPEADAGMTGVAGDGEAIRCTAGSPGRWEPV